jgi:hypothetical protein
VGGDLLGEELLAGPGDVVLPGARFVHVAVGRQPPDGLADPRWWVLAGLAERRAVESVLDFYVSPENRQRDAGVIEEKILSQAGSCIKRRKIRDKQKEGSTVSVRLRAFVALPKLALELEKAGAVRPEGVAGTPSLSVFIHNGGRGQSPTSEAEGLGAMAVAAWLATREAKLRAVLLPSLLTFDQRRAHYPSGNYCVLPPRRTA